MFHLISPALAAPSIHATRSEAELAAHHVTSVFRAAPWALVLDATGGRVCTHTPGSISYGPASRTRPVLRALTIPVLALCRMVLP
jgi:hypothetical protein